MKKLLIVRFFQESSGKEPVKAWLGKLTDADRVTIAEDLQTLQFGWPIGMPLARSLGRGLWEMRSRLDTRISRIIFVVKNGEIILLNGFIKKTQKTPTDELDLALGRLKRFEQ